MNEFDPLSLRKKKFDSLDYNNYNKIRQSLKLKMRKDELFERIQSNRNKILEQENSLLTQTNFLHDYFDSIVSNLKTENLPTLLSTSQDKENFIKEMNQLLTSELQNKEKLSKILEVYVEVIFKIQIPQKLFFQKESYTPIYNNLYFTYHLDQGFSEKVLYFLGLISNEDIGNQITLYNSGIFINVINETHPLQDEIKNLDSKVWFLSQFNLKKIFEINLELTLKLQKLYFDILLASNDLIEKTNSLPLLCNTIWGISKISTCNNKKFIENFFKFDIIEFLITIKSRQCQVPIMRIIGNLLSNDFYQIERMITPEFIRFIDFNLSNTKSSNELKHHCLWAISNILFEQSFIDKAFEYKIIDSIVGNVNKDNPFEIDIDILICLGCTIQPCDDSKRFTLINKFDFCNVIRVIHQKYISERYNQKEFTLISINAISIALSLLQAEMGSALLAKGVFERIGYFELLDVVMSKAYNVSGNDGNNLINLCEEALKYSEMTSLDEEFDSDKTEDANENMVVTDA